MTIQEHTWVYQIPLLRELQAFAYLVALHKPYYYHRYGIHYAPRRNLYVSILATMDSLLLFTVL